MSQFFTGNVGVVIDKLNDLSFSLTEQLTHGFNSTLCYINFEKENLFRNKFEH